MDGTLTEPLTVAGNEWGWTHHVRGLAGNRANTDVRTFSSVGRGHRASPRNWRREMFMLLLLRRLSPRSRMIAGVVLGAAGLAW